MVDGDGARLHPYDGVSGGGERDYMDRVGEKDNGLVVGGWWWLHRCWGLGWVMGFPGFDGVLVVVFCEVIVAGTPPRADRHPAGLPLAPDPRQVLLSPLTGFGSQAYPGTWHACEMRLRHG